MLFWNELLAPLLFSMVEAPLRSQHLPLVFEHLAEVVLVVGASPLLSRHLPAVSGHLAEAELVVEASTLPRARAELEHQGVGQLVVLSTPAPFRHRCHLPLLLVLAKSVMAILSAWAFPWETSGLESV